MRKLTLVLILIAVVVSGCKTAKVSGSEGNTSAPSDPKSAVIEASRKFIALKSFKGTIEAVAEPSYKQQVDYVAPDRYHVVYREASGHETEMIMVGNDAYTKDGDSWKKNPGATAPTPTIRNSWTEEALNSISEVKFEGEESLSGQPALVYTYTVMTVVGNFPTKRKIWVSKSTGIPMKSYVEYSNGPIKTLTNTFDTESPVTIELPPKK